jgi:SAM-dependent methyltransferase
MLRFAGEIVGDGMMPVLDAGCGSGRHSVALAAIGSSVIAVDKDRERLSQLSRLADRYLASQGIDRRRPGKVQPVCAELQRKTWLFRRASLSAIVCIHFLDVDILDAFADSLLGDGRLYIETFGGQGENYFDLPKAGELYNLLSPDFTFMFYKERPVGPAAHGSVAVKLLARKVRK